MQKPASIGADLFYRLVLKASVCCFPAAAVLECTELLQQRNENDHQAGKPVLLIKKKKKNLQIKPATAWLVLPLFIVSVLIINLIVRGLVYQGDEKCVDKLQSQVEEIFQIPKYWKK